MADRNDDGITKKHVVVIQDVIIKSKDSTGDNLQKTNEENGNENGFCKSRFTASTCIFDEEPVFSDSEEEKEYSKQIFSTQTSLYTVNSTKEIPKEFNIDSVCDLNSEELKVMDIVIKCASINVGNINEDFKRFIEIGKQLTYKYKWNDPTNSEKAQFNGSLGDEVQQFMPTSSTDSDRQQQLVPSRSGSWGGIFSLSNNNCDPSDPSSNRTIERDKGHGKTLRRTTRKLKPFSPREYGMFIVGKNRKKLLKRSGKILENVNAEEKRVKTRSTKTKSVANVLKGKILDEHEKSTNIEKINSLDNLETISIDNIMNFCNPRDLLLKRQTRTLARSWMKPGKVNLKNLLRDLRPRRTVPKKQIGLSSNTLLNPNNHVGENETSVATEATTLEKKRKSRRIYSEKNWMDSEEFINTYKTTETNPYF